LVSQVWATTRLAIDSDQTLRQGAHPAIEWKQGFVEFVGSNGLEDSTQGTRRGDAMRQLEQTLKPSGFKDGPVVKRVLVAHAAECGEQANGEDVTQLME
jgi:hypothetical protein